MPDEALQPGDVITQREFESGNTFTMRVGADFCAVHGFEGEALLAAVTGGMHALGGINCCADCALKYAAIGRAELEKRGQHGG